MTLSAAQESGLLTAQTIRLARHLGYLYGEDRDEVILATACAITSLSAGSVCFDLEQARHWPSETPLDWPDTDEWTEALQSSPMVSTDLGARDRPLILDHQSVYLTRYWAEQDRIVEWLGSRLDGQSVVPATRPAEPNRSTSEPRTRQKDELRKDAHWEDTHKEDTHLRDAHQEALDLFFEEESGQKQAARMACRFPVCVIAGGPGTGKTTAVARILAVLGQTRSEPLRVILTAPTGRAAARLEQAVRENLAACHAVPGSDFDVRCTSGTIHRVLGIKPWGSVDHDSSRPLPGDLIVVDEASMLSLHLMSLLLDAVCPTTRLILVGDPDQLASVEAGAVLADIVTSSGTVPVTRLTRTYRFSGDIADLAEAIRQGDADQALAILGRESDQIEWVPADLEAAGFTPDSLTSLRADLTNQGLAMIDAGKRGDRTQALRLLDSHRLLLAHRHGISGVSQWTSIVRQWLSRASSGDVAAGHWYPGMPILITRNDDLLGIFNGDSGVILSGESGLSLAVNDGSGSRLISPDMIQSWEPLYASTIHKSQGSQYDRVSLILPPSSTILLSRELFYTAVTRAKSFLRVIGSAEAVRQAIESPALRASGLASRLARIQVRPEA